MISNLLSEIESYTLRNVQEREQVRSPVDRSATEEPLTPEAKQLEIEGRKKLSSDGGGEVLTVDHRPKIPLKQWCLYSARQISQTRRSWIN